MFVPETVSVSTTKYVKSVPKATRATNRSTNISLDPDNILPNDICHEFELLYANYDSVLDPIFSGYNGKADNFKAIVNMGPVQPPQRKGRLPQYSRNELVELQEHFDRLETLEVVKRPEEVGVVAEYLNPSFLVKKSSGGHRLVTAFGEVGNYTKPQPSLMPNVDSTLRQIARCKYLITSDLISAFYQIPLDTESMKYCGVATPFQGVRIYTRCAMGMPSSETALEKLMIFTVVMIHQRSFATIGNVFYLPCLKMGLRLSAKKQSLLQKPQQFLAVYGPMMVQSEQALIALLHLLCVILPQLQ